MKRLKQILITIILLFGLYSIWFWVDTKDYFKAEYNDLTKEQENLFKWKESDNEKSLQEKYRNHFTDKEFSFPRQKVSKVKIFKNNFTTRLFTSKTLNQELIEPFIIFCNDTTNFNWKETTWQTDESEYYLKFYNEKNKVIGKIYFCLDDCGMTSSRPFCPAMKFGGLTENGLKQIRKIINEKTYWN
jgi:hypothetical protein